MRRCTPMCTIADTFYGEGISRAYVCKLLKLTRKEFVWYSKGLLDLTPELIDTISQHTPYSKRFLERLSAGWKVTKTRLLHY